MRIHTLDAFKSFALSIDIRTEPRDELIDEVGAPPIWTRRQGGKKHPNYMRPVVNLDEPQAPRFAQGYGAMWTLACGRC
ncbi:hypothetical protein Q7C36_018963 [Tachysurus vachellii]|uniref:Uncharacterized protein n=1 Tax=Tachysurus vachellii TaxID=175792 RepID=A0AA88LWD0_TACVA|nr:hypothetical protein Q7C36_018963 [Tachysurus vachellii]